MMESMQVSIPDESRIEEQDLIVVNTPIVLTMGFLTVERAIAGKPIPRHVRLLGPSAVDLTITRTDSRTVRVRPIGGYLRAPFDRLFRGRDAPFLLSEVVELPGVVVEITRLDEDGLPSEVTFRFDEPLESEAYQWVVWRGEAYEAFKVPEVGETMEVPCSWPGL